MHPPQKAPQQRDGGTHLSGSVSADLAVFKIPGIHDQHMPFPVRFASGIFQHLQHMLHVRDAGAMMKNEDTLSQNRRRQNRQRSIFRSLYQQFSLHSLRAFDI